MSTEDCFAADVEFGFSELKSISDSVKYFDSLLLIRLPSLIERVEILNRLRVREFVDAGGLDLIFESLIISSKYLKINKNKINKNKINKNKTENLKYYCAIKYVVEVLSEWATTVIDTYDGELGKVSCLVYFLCERHKYSVDINWSYSKLEMMSKFQLSMLSLILGDNDQDNDNDQDQDNEQDKDNDHEITPTAELESALTTEWSSDEKYSDLISNEIENIRFSCLHLLSTVLISYPALRVAPQFVAVWTKSRISDLLDYCNHLLKNPLLVLSDRKKYDTDKKKEEIKNSENIISSDLSKDEILISCGIGSVLCSLQMFTAVLTFGLGLPFTSRYNSTIGCGSARRLLFRNERCSCQFCDRLRRMKKVANHRDEFGIKQSFPFQSSLALNMSSSHSVSFLNESVSLLSEYLNELKISQGAEICALDRSLTYLSTILNLISNNYANKYNKTILMHSDKDKKSLGVLLCELLQFHKLKRYLNISHGGFPPGMRSLIECVSNLLTSEISNPKSQNENVDDLFTSASETFGEILFQSSEIMLLQIGYPKSRKGFTRFSIHMTSTIASLSSLMHLLLRHPSPNSSPHENSKGEFEYSEDAYVSGWDENKKRILIQLAVEIYEGYLWVGFDKESNNFQKKEFLSSLLTLMAFLTGTYEFTNSIPARRLLISPPDPHCGFMVEATRRISTDYPKIFPDSGCVFLKRILKVVNHRAEKASAISIHQSNILSSSKSDEEKMNLDSRIICSENENEINKNKIKNKRENEEEELISSCCEIVSENEIASNDFVVVNI